MDGKVLTDRKKVRAVRRIQEWEKFEENCRKLKELEKRKQKDLQNKEEERREDKKKESDWDCFELRTSLKWVDLPSSPPN